MSDEFTLQTRLLHAFGSDCRTISEIAEALDVTTSQVSDAAARLIERGYLEREERGCFSLTNSGRSAVANNVKIVSGPRGPLSGVRAPTADGIRQRAWNVMRLKRRFTIPDLLTVVTTGEERQPATALQEYMRALVKSGHVRLTGRRISGTRHGQSFREFSLVKDSGDFAPSLIRRETVVLDNNDGSEVAL